MVKSLITLPTFFALIFSFVVGPLALKFNKVKLLIIMMSSMGAYSLIFFFTGIFKGPFVFLIIACVLAGFAQGGFAPLMNTIIGENFESKARAGRIASYNVATNIGSFAILFISGRIAAGNNGADWPYAYLLGLYCFIVNAIFLILIKKSGYRDDKKARSNRNLQFAKKNSTQKNNKKVSKKIWLFIIGIGLLHCIFYIGINAYYINISDYIITIHKLGNSIQVSNATSLVRFTLIIMTFLYPFWQKILKDWMMPAGYFLSAIGLIFLLTITSNIWGAYICAFFIAFGINIVHSTIYSKALNYVPENIEAVSSSIIWGLANSGPFFATYVLSGISLLTGGGVTVQIQAGIIILAFVTVIAAIIFVFKKPQLNN